MSQVVNAAVVNDYKSPPRYQQIELAAPSDKQFQVTVLAAALHPLVKARASGMHYSADVTLPLIVGADGVGQLASGEIVYLMAYSGSSGTFAERANVLREDCLPIPKLASPNTIAALVNPGTPAWIALRCRAVPKQGFSVLILGVTGTAGQLAIHIARFLGASRIVGVGRNQEMLEQLLKTGLDVAIALGDDEQKTKELIAKEAGDIDVVLDYIWGRPAELAMSSIISARKEKSERLDWVQCGSMAGPNITFPAAVLRMSNFFLSGTGLGPLSPSIMRSEVSELIKMLTTEKPPVSIDVRPLSDVEKLWNSKTDGRQVFSMLALSPSVGGAQ